MTLPVSPNAISFSQINTELGLSATAQISLNDAAVRTLFGKASGAIAMSDGHGKANQFAFTISTAQTNANLRSLAVAAGWNQTTKVVATINSGVQISSTSTGTPALTINGSFPGGVELINAGTILGKGGRGGDGGWGPNQSLTTTSGSPGSAGGTALLASVALTLNNASGIICGGGGGGGGGSLGAAKAGQNGGGGGGGGNGTGAGGGPGRGDVYGGGGASGGVLTGGAGGSGGNRGGVPSAAGGAGGTNAAAGSTGGNAGYGGGSGGSGGLAVSGNANITYISTGTRYGGIA